MRLALSVRRSAGLPPLAGYTAMHSLVRQFGREKQLRHHVCMCVLVLFVDGTVPLRAALLLGGLC